MRLDRVLLGGKMLTQSARSLTRKHIDRVVLSKRCSNGNTCIRTRFNGRDIENDVRIQKTPYLGQWDREGTVYIDPSVPKKYRKSIALHEAIERDVAMGNRWCKRKKDMMKAHWVADPIERRWNRKHNINQRVYDRKMEELWRRRVRWSQNNRRRR